MTWIKKVNKVCKCGHKLDPDHKNDKTILGIKYNSGSKCNGTVKIENTIIPCCCTKFLDRRFPQKFDKAMMIACFVAVGLFIFVFGSMLSIINIAITCHTTACNLALDKPQFTLRDVSAFLFMFVLLFTIWQTSNLIPFDYFKNKKRLVEPIKDQEETKPETPNEDEIK